MIPKIIHYVWINFKDIKSYSLETLPEKYKINIQRCQFINPDFEIKLWSGGACYDLIKTKYAKYLDLYESLSEPIMKCDMIRFIILYEYGGVYSDLDRICQRNYAGLFKPEYDVILARMPYSFIDFINHDIVIAKPKSHFIFQCFGTIKLHKTNNIINDVSTIAGGDHVTQLYKQYKGPEKIKIMGIELQPCSVLGCEPEIINCYSYADVINMSWMPESERFIRTKIVPRLVYLLFFLSLGVILILIIWLIIK